MTQLKRKSGIVASEYLPLAKHTIQPFFTNVFIHFIVNFLYLAAIQSIVNGSKLLKGVSEEGVDVCNGCDECE